MTSMDRMLTDKGLHSGLSDIFMDNLIKVIISI